LAPLRRASPLPPCHLPLITRLDATQCDQQDHIPVLLLHS
jgi:hypothetical protein